ncbi:glucokinase [Solimonas sp. K1W22B-7]|uniref:glucokinase n=1 Tax=Solimonas sp. K1W22B-7 TaxID=2303331 RepID=UPI000E32FBB9|nr:glucokinase [Solimonas sp. K1W22B-7]AXQ28580.1 glucokinase [Solimonas sp. K1W22B-7]
MSMEFPDRSVRLVADIGGSTARFALLDPGSGTPQRGAELATASHATLADAVETYLGQQGELRPSEAVIAIANPVLGDQVSMTNHHWSFSVEATRQRLGLRRLLVINDFTALALSLPRLSPAELQQVGGQSPLHGPMALLGPGTGLGVSGLVPAGAGQWLPICGEGGHATLATTNAREADIVAACRELHGHVSAERLLSGVGLPCLHRAIATLGRSDTTALTPAEIVTRGIAGDDAACAETLAVFCSLLGGFAGNLALTLGARGGVYIGGGIVPRLGEYFARSAFRARFESKGRFCGYLAPLPVYVIHALHPALRGAAAALDHPLELGVDARGT